MKANVAGLPKTGCIRTMGNFIIAIFITLVTDMITVINYSGGIDTTFLGDLNLVTKFGIIKANKIHFMVD